MGAAARVADGGDAVDVLRRAPSVHGGRAVRRTELRGGYAGQARPAVGRNVQIQALVQVQADAELRLVDGEVRAEPSEEERDDVGVTVGEADPPVALRTL